MKQLAFFMNPSHLSWKDISWLSDQICNANHLIFTGYDISTLVMSWAQILENGEKKVWQLLLLGKAPKCPSPCPSPKASRLASFLRTPPSIWSNGSQDRAPTALFPLASKPCLRVQAFALPQTLNLLHSSLTVSSFSPALAPGGLHFDPSRISPPPAGR